MRVLSFGRDATFPSGYDYAFEKAKDFEKMLPYLYKKIEGDWLILLVDLTLQEMSHVVDDLEIPPYLDVVAMMKKDNIGKFILKHPKFKIEQRSKWQEYLDYLATVSKVIENKASSELFKRCHGEINLIKEKMDELVDMPSETITMRDLNCITVADDRTYASDVMLTLWVKHNNTIDRKGSILSKYKYLDIDKVSNTFLNELGNEFAFYSIRKYLRKIYEEKSKYLNNETVKDNEVCKRIDIYTILFSLVTFELSNPRQIRVCLEVIKRRESEDDSLFERTILAHYSKHADFKVG